ncbi:MAG: CCA tRNA nucleotidyltransferase [Candidatus Nanohaloarchaeota archaeon QJJ-7]|nr:CCA tRNA nucleotidyltransferase [Candidatus Nanohaloarchaeota archaeon QJJ-7]
MSHREVREKVVEQVMPEESEGDSAQEMFSQVQEFVEEEFGKEAGLMGSTAKGTFMRGDKDLDIFVFFDESMEEEQLEEEGLEIGEAVFERFDGEYEVEYAEHPYTKGDIEDYEVEVVPAYRVDSGEDIKSSVDRTPFHKQWVNENLSEEEKEEVVLLKAFLRGQELYGSTLRVEGFAGYLCELLIAEYGSFEELLKAAVDWKEEEVIDPEGRHDKLPNYLKEKFSEDSLVVIDPVDEERNVASVLSTENYARFVFSAWAYLQEPGEEFFFPEEVEADREGLETAAETRGDFVTVEFETPDMIDDMLYPQMRRLLSRLELLLEDNEFRLFQSGFYIGEERTRILFELFSDELPGMRKHLGPKMFHNQEHVENFTDKYGEVWVEDTRLATVVERDHKTAENLLEGFLAGGLQEKGVPKNLVPVVEGAEIKGLEFDDEDWRKFLRDEFHLEVGQ